ncbi:hypothetical protein AB0J35_31695 [Nonomuraea angiospora]|uniref:hypothetical protein n=1 Tax=Nonomuraea angiospora TaxID=46172 RepID=UPI00342C113E
MAPETYLEYGPGEVARAQWANAAAGPLMAAVVPASLIPFRQPLPRLASLSFADATSP